MANDTPAAQGNIVEGDSKCWRPSQRPLHHASVQKKEGGKIVEQLAGDGILGAFGRYLKRPFVRLVIGLGLFILGAIVYDATVNFGSWTERAGKPKATKHRGLAPIQQTPDG